MGLPAEEQSGDESADSPSDDKDKQSKPATIYYVSDEQQQAQYIKMFKDAGLNAIICDNFIDPHFVSYLEYKAPDKLKFMRIDADIAGALKGDDVAEDSVLIDIFKNAIGDEKLTIKTQALKNTAVPAIINVDEYMRRYSEMGAFYGMSEGETAKTMVLNTSNPVIASIKELDDEKQKFVAGYVYSLALLSFKKLTPDEFEKFMNESEKLLAEYVK